MSDPTKLFLLLSIQAKGGEMPPLGSLGPEEVGTEEIHSDLLQELVLDGIINDPFHRPAAWTGHQLPPHIISNYFLNLLGDRMIVLSNERDVRVRNLSAQIDIVTNLFHRLELRAAGHGCAGATWGGSATNAQRIWESPDYQALYLQHSLTSASAAPSNTFPIRVLPPFPATSTPLPGHAGVMLSEAPSEQGELF